MRRFVPIVVLVAGACGDVVAPSVQDQAAVRVMASVTAAVEGVTIEITAPDIDPPLLRNIPVVSGEATGVLHIPAGAARTLTVRAYDAGGVETHRGSETLDVLPGENVALTISLESLAGDVPITVDLVTYVVALTPSDTTIVVGESFTYSVTVETAEGDPVASPEIAWGSTAPDVARVDESGLGTAVADGTATVAANYRGTVALATVTVTP